MNFKAIVSAFAIACAPLVASAATMINVGDFVVENNTMAGDGEVISITSGGDAGSLGSYIAEYTFTAEKDLRVSDFVTVQTTGIGADDVLEVEFGYTGATISDVAMFHDPGSVTFNGATFGATSALDGFVLLAGESFTVFFERHPGGGGKDFNVSNQFSFLVSSVPLPAGGLLLLTALGGLGIARRKKAA